VLEADVEVDRREFTLRAAIRVLPGERLALFGPSGAGKTTLLEVIAGLVVPRRGKVSLAGRVLTTTGNAPRLVPPWQRGVGLLRQDPGIFPHLSVRANLAYARDARHAELDGLADQLGLGGLLDAMPARLSGGQAHRVALGRLLLARCDALLLDEPYTGLDASLRRSLTTLVAGLVTARQIPSVLVAHELADAQAFADRLAIIDQGVLLQDGTPDGVVLRPASRRVAELVGYLGFIPAAPAGTVAVGTVAGGTVAGIHPDRVLAGDHPAQGMVTTGIVTAVRPSGAIWEADLLVGPAPVTVRLTSPPPPPGGELVITAIDPPRFAPDGTAINDIAINDAAADPAGNARHPHRGQATT
jgi:ABC-type sulfate/molybdate transport systems ATPase subunit